MRTMTDTLYAPTRPPKSSTGSWLVLVVGSLLAFLLGAGAQVLAYVGFGLCMESDESLCDAGTLPTAWEWVVATVPTYLIWVTPAAVAAILGYRVLKSGNRAGRAVIVAAVVVATLITIGCAAMWWI